jgi:hypothetical protein
MGTEPVKYLLIRKQRGEGCDYTIGCGTAINSLGAATAADALTEAKQLLFGDDPEHYDVKHDEHRLRNATIVQVVQAVPLDAWYAELEGLAAARVAREQDARDRADLERLSKKFGPK